MTESQRYKLLCYGIGNISRGDDALGPRLMEWLKTHYSDNPYYDFTLEEVFQLQPENIYEFTDQDLILFLDADARIEEGICFQPTETLSTHNAFVSHALAPEKLLSMFQELKKKAPPKAYTLSMGAKDMSLHDGLSELSAKNLNKAQQLLSTLMETRPESWDKLEVAI